VVAIFTEKLLAGKTPTIFGSGEHTRDYVYVDDVVAANVSAVAKRRRQIFNIGTGVENRCPSCFQVGVRCVRR